MKPIALALLAALASPLPATAQQPEEGSGLMERGLRLFMDGLRDEMEPALRDLHGMARDAAPMLRQLQERLGEVVQDLDAYEAPEILENGDILIRRKVPLEPDEALPPAPEGAIDL